MQDCTSPTQFSNQAISLPFTKNNCPANTTPAMVNYTVPANTYTASTQAQADGMAQNDVSENGQLYANTHALCLSGGVYLKLRRENFTYSGDYTYGDVVARFYADPGGTVPLTVNNLTVNLKETLFVEFDNTSTDYPFTFVCNGSQVVVKHQVLQGIFENDSWIEHYFFLQPGTGYSIISSNQYSWQN